jgi:hypothetical protein
MQNRLITTFNRIPQPLHRNRSRNCVPLSTGVGHLSSPKKHLANHKTLFNLHNSHNYHRDRGACGFLLVS